MWSSPCSEDICNLHLDEVETGKDDIIVQGTSQELEVG